MNTLIGRRAAAQFFSTRSPSVKKLGLDLESLSDGEMKRLMLEEPRLLRRPLLKAGRSVLVGFDAAAWQAALVE